MQFSYASLLLQLGDSSGARPALERCLAVEPEHTAALNNLIRIDLSGGLDLPRALELSRRLVELQPTALNYDLLAWAYYVNGQTKRAREASARSVELDPENPTFKARYGRLKDLP